MIITLILLALTSIGAGYALHKNIYLNNKNPTPPPLDTPEDIINYLEACSLAQNNEESYRLFTDFKTFTSQKQLPGSSEQKPDWFHSTNVAIPSDKHWELFFNDLKRETEPGDKIAVIKHWMLDLQNWFTYKEMEMILDEFPSSTDRAKVRKIYAARQKEKKSRKS